CTLQLLLERIDLLSERLDLRTLGLPLLLDILNGPLSLVGCEDGLLKGDESNLCRDGLRWRRRGVGSWSSGGCSGGRSGGSGRLRQRSGSRQSRAKSGDKNKGAIHAVCGTPS